MSLSSERQVVALMLILDVIVAGITFSSTITHIVDFLKLTFVHILERSMYFECGC